MGWLLADRYYRRRIFFSSVSDFYWYIAMKIIIWTFAPHPHPPLQKNTSFTSAACLNMTAIALCLKRYFSSIFFCKESLINSQEWTSKIGDMVIRYCLVWSLIKLIEISQLQSAIKRSAHHFILSYHIQLFLLSPIIFRKCDGLSRCWKSLALDPEMTLTEWCF